MTEPDTAGLRPDAASHARGSRRTTATSSTGTSGSPRTARSPTSSIVMAVTDPDAAPHERASMFLVPVDDARREHRPRRAQHGAPVPALRDARRAHGDPATRTSASARGAARQGGRGLPDRPAPARPRPDPSLHALARRRASRLRHALRALALPRGARRAAEGQADRPELDRRLGRRDAGRAADDAARRLEDRPVRVERGAARRLADQVLRREGAARRDRPRAPAPRRARLLDRHAARDALPLRPSRPLRRRRRRGAPRVGRAADPEGVRGARGRHPDRARADAPRGARSRSSPTILDAVLVEG